MWLQSNTENLSRHIKAVHLNNDMDKIKCTDCDYETVLKSNLTRHRKLFHSENSTKYNCTICTFKTKHENNLKRHVKSVHQTNIYRCKSTA